MLRIAMLSYWHVHASDYTGDILDIPEAEITVVWDEDRTRGTQWAEDLGADYVAEVDDAVTRDDVDAVVVCAPTNKHPDVMIPAARAGKHIFTEKVLALTTAEADRIAEAVAEAGVEFCISYPRRTEPGLRFIREAIDEGWLGDVTLLRSRVAHTGSIDDWLPAHFFDPEACGGGAMIDLGAHPMYTIEYLMGTPQRLTAQYANVRKDIDVEDNAVAVMQYEDGGLAIAESSFSSRFSPFTVEAHGTEGTVFYGMPGGAVQIRSRKLDDERISGRIVPESLPDAPPSPIEQWVEAIRGDRSHKFDIEAARNLTAMMEASNTSAEEGRTVDIS